MADGTLFPHHVAAHISPASRPLIVDSFAGGGGASTGIEIALGRAPDVAINHYPAALALHAANHPDTLHLTTSIHAVDPSSVVARGQRVGLAWFSPDCKHHSKAKGGKPLDKNIRDLAWVVVHWAERVAPEVILLENVEEFQDWCPLGDDHRPIAERRGETFRLWVKRLKRLGYKVEWRELRACDYGAPTIRKRLFVVARRDGRPITWPRPTHGDPKSDAVKAGQLLPWRTAAECIDWSLPCPSIFDTAPEIMARHGLRAVRPLAPNTLARVARGMKRYVIESDRPFIVNLTHGGRNEDAADPFRTITGAHRGEKALAAPALATIYGHGNGRGVRSADMAEPLRTVTVENRHALILPSITRFNGGATGSDLRDPLGTVTANSYIKRPGGASPLGLLAPILASIAHGDSGGRRKYPLSEPLGTVTVGGIQHAVIAPHLMTMRNAGKPYNGADEPTHTVTAGGAGLTLVAPVLTYAQQGGSVRQVDAPHHTICASPKDQNAVIAAALTHLYTSNSAGGEGDPDMPAKTVTAGGNHHAVMASFLAQQNTGVIGRDACTPLSTICQTGTHQTPVAAFFAKYYGTGDGARHDEPSHTVTTRDRFGHVETALAAPPFGPEHETRARDVADFLRAHDAWDDREFVTLTIDGATFVVVDIGLRMLTPRELYRAQGFPEDYVIEGVWRQEGDDWRFEDFPKDVQISCVGNSVCPPLAEALVRANCAHLAEAAADQWAGRAEEQEAGHG